ncbi:MAG: protein phosphatase, partial [Candidatus Accumulibacter sp.]|nr:protein phosphatase [Accumulibacter sp.]
MANTLSEALEYAARTDPGLVRRKNEDSYFADASRGLFILADGMGGYDAGEVASQMATSMLSSKMLEFFLLHPEYAVN